MTAHRGQIDPARRVATEGQARTKVAFSGQPASEKKVSEPDPRRWYALALLVMAQFIVILDAAIVNVALPTIKTHLHFSTPNLQYVVTVYAITFGGLLLLGGRLADRLGRRILFVAGVLVFTVASLLDGMSTGSGELVGFRALQGVGAALLTPAALSLLVTAFTEEGDRNLALGIWAAALGSGAGAGLLLGGVLTTVASWRWIFFINIPIGAAVTVLSPMLLRESRGEGAARSFDFAGAASITGGLMLLIYGLTRPSQHGWGNGTTVGVLAGSVALIVVFVGIERRSRAPLLPLRLFRMRTLSGSNVAMLFLASGGYALFLLTTLYFQQVLHYSAIKTGVSFLAVPLSLLISATVVQRLVGRVGVRFLLPAGLLLVAVGYVLLARLLVHARYFADIFPPLLPQGVGSALIFVPGQIGAQRGVKPKDSGVASGLINLSQQVGGAIGVAVAVTLATTATRHYLHHHAASGAIANAALVHGYHVAFRVVAGVAGAAAVLTALMVEAKPNRIEPVGEAPKERPCMPGYPCGAPVHLTEPGPA